MASSVASGSRRSAARNSTAAITPAVPRIGKQNAVLSPASTADVPRGTVGSAPTSTSQAGSPLAHTRPGRPSPGASDIARHVSTNWSEPCQVSMQRSPAPGSGSVHTAPVSQPSDAPIAASSRGWAAASSGASARTRATACSVLSSTAAS